MATTLSVNKELLFHSIQLLTHFSTKQHIDCLQVEAMNAASYNDLFFKGLLVFVKGDGLGLYVQTSQVGKQLIGDSDN
jgi:hypothetical protein